MYIGVLIWTERHMVRSELALRLGLGSKLAFAPNGWLSTQLNSSERAVDKPLYFNMQYISSSHRGNFSCSAQSLQHGVMVLNYSGIVNTYKFLLWNTQFHNFDVFHLFVYLLCGRMKIATSPGGQGRWAWSHAQQLVFMHIYTTRRRLVMQRYWFLEFDTISIR